MTFPRRLTPSDTERATIVQQRMAPGGALGVGSRHVRSHSVAASQSAAPAGGEPIGWAQYEDHGTPSYGSGGIHPSVLVNSGGDASGFGYDGFHGISFAEAGWYQVTVYGAVSLLNGGDVVRISAIFGGMPAESQGYGIAPGGGGTAYLYAAAAPYFADAGRVIEMAVDTVTVTTLGSSIDSPGLYLVRLA